MFEPNEEDWLFYLAQPTRLLRDCETFSNTRKVTLLKQFLSQAEITDKRSNAANSDNLILDTVHTDFDPPLDTMNSDTFQPYKKSKILDVMSLQLAADMKFNLNLFGITIAMPVKILIRLCRTLVTNTARHSTALKHLFELAADRDSMFLVDPYSTYTWANLHPTTIYAIMCYHIMCFQVSIAGSLLPRPFRSFTPAVSGLTEVPAATFFPDMPVDIGSILTRILESVNQLLDIYNLLGDINIARPLPSAFCPFESANPPVLEPQSDGVPESKDNDLSHLYNAKLLTKEYVSATINFVIGRYDFQQHQFDRARERFERVIELMNSEQVDYLDECGVTVKLVSAYMTACHSYSLTQSPCISLSEYNEPRLFVEHFSHSLDHLTNSSYDNSTTPFWLDRCCFSSKIQLHGISCEESTSLCTVEDFLCKTLMDDICLLVLKNSDSTNNMPLGLGLRQWLEKLCLKQLVQSTTRSFSCAVGNRIHQSPHKSNRQTKTNSENAVAVIQASGKLFTKVHINNALERLVSNSFELPLQFVREILTGQLNPSPTSEKQRELSENSTWDFRFAREFLLHSLYDLLTVIDSKNKELASSHYKRLIPQFIMFLIQEGISLIEESCTVVKITLENIEPIKEFHSFINSLRSHKLTDYLPPNCIQLINATLSKYAPEQKLRNIDHELPGLSDPFCDVEKTVDGSQVGDFDLRTELGFPSDTDMSNIETSISSSSDVDMSPFASLNYHQSFGFTGFRGHGQSGHSGPPGPISQSDSSSLVPNANCARRLLCSLEPGEINFCVGNLLRTGMTPDTILGLNSAWIPNLRYFISIAGPRLNPPMEANMQDPLECSISFTNNVPNLLSILIQLAKASINTRHQTTTLLHSRTLLLTSLSSLNHDAPPSNPTRPLQCALWIRAALRHELLLTDLLDFLDPSTAAEHLPTLLSRDQQRHKSAKKNQSLGFGTFSKVKLNSLSNRAKICIFHAVGLPDSAKDLESVADSNNPVCLSNELLSASACFLLSIGEQQFLTSVFAIPKHGNVSHRRSYFNSLELIRMLLCLHDCMIAVQSTYLKRNDELKLTGSDSGSHMADMKISKNLSDTNWSHQQTLSKCNDKSPHFDRLKAVAEELFNFMVYGCLTIEHKQRKQVGPHGNTPNINDTFDHQRTPWSNPGSSNCQLTISELCTIIQYLTSIIEPSDMGRPSNTKTHSETKRKSAGIDQSQSQRTVNGLELLNFLLICSVHLLHAVIPSISLSCWKDLSELSNCPAQSNPTNSSSDSCSIANENKTTKVRATKPDDIALRTKERNSPLDFSILLSTDLWPTEVNTQAQVSSNMLSELVQFLITCLLTIHPNRIDLLALRSEIEYFKKDYRSTLSTYLELGAIVSDSFTSDISSTIYTTEIVSRMVHCCKSLGLIYEAIVLCQFNSDPDLIETGVQMIIGQLENLAPAGPTNSNGTNGPTMTHRVFTESFTGSCGGLLTQSVLDCPDDLVNYVWEIRLIETLATSSARRGALSQLAKFRGFLNTPEINSNNPEEVLNEHRIATKLQFLRHLTDLCLI